MGGLISTIEKRWSPQGYYNDMVAGYISRAGGWPYMIRFPRELQILPKRCPHCNLSSTLVLEDMIQRLKRERQGFQDHVDSIVASRLAEGEPNPYPCYEEAANERLKVKRRSDSLNFLGNFKKNVIVPEENSWSQNPEDPFYYPVKIDDLIVCKCMDFKRVEIEVAEEDEQSGVETVVISKCKENLQDDNSLTEDEQTGKK